ncbi:MAG TPA: hypothetical protein VHA80_12855 [Solirubrobacterales bacterium]|nr:hypothetical protein [Solirubrobacterales bacterium]
MSQAEASTRPDRMQTKSTTLQLLEQRLIEIDRAPHPIRLVASRQLRDSCDQGGEPRSHHLRPAFPPVISGPARAWCGAHGRRRDPTPSQQMRAAISIGPKELRRIGADAPILHSVEPEWTIGRPEDGVPSDREEAVTTDEGRGLVAHAPPPADGGRQDRAAMTSDRGRCRPDPARSSAACRARIRSDISGAARRNAGPVATGSVATRPITAGTVASYRLQKAAPGGAPTPAEGLTRGRAFFQWLARTLWAHARPAEPTDPLSSSSYRAARSVRRPASMPGRPIGA